MSDVERQHRFKDRLADLARFMLNFVKEADKREFQALLSSCDVVDPLFDWEHIGSGTGVEFDPEDEYLLDEVMNKPQSQNN